MWVDLIDNCSTERLEKYLSKTAEDRLAAEFLYVANHKISEGLFPLISVLEVTLRNCVHTTMSSKYGTAEWWVVAPLAGSHDFQPSLEKIRRAKQKIYMRGGAQSVAQVKAGQVVAEVSFGFWTDLFQEELSTLLWSDLLLGIKHIPDDSRKRRKVGKPLQSLKVLRNRVMHHEPILFDQSASPDALHQKGVELMSWIAPSMNVWLGKFDRFAEVWGSYQRVRVEFDKWMEIRKQIKAARERGEPLTGLFRARDAQKRVFDELAKAYIG